MIRIYPFIFILLWSSAFITTKPIVDNSDPFSALAFRFFFVALGFYGFSIYSNQTIIVNQKNLIESVLSGVLFHGFYLGGVFYSISIGMPTGIAALIVTLQPILTNALSGPILGEKVTNKQWTGVLLGFTGAVLVLGLDIGSNIPILGLLATIVALISSGLPTSSFVFEGFLPKKQIDREKILLEISKNEKTTIIYESPKRFRKLLKELFDFCGGNREIMVARELTKKFEEHVGNNINEVIEFFKDRDIIGEITIVVKGIKKGDFHPDKFIIKKDLNDLINAGLSLSAASKYLAKKNGIKKSEVYNMI